MREVGGRATWSLSSCKPGFGVEQLRDDRYDSLRRLKGAEITKYFQQWVFFFCSCDTYWQSDGQLPHLVNVQVIFFLERINLNHFNFSSVERPQWARSPYIQITNSMRVTLLPGEQQTYQNLSSYQIWLDRVFWKYLVKEATWLKKLLFAEYL